MDMGEGLRSAARTFIVEAFHQPPGAWTRGAPNAHPSAMDDVVATLCRDVVGMDHCVSIVQEAVQDDVALHHELCVGRHATVHANLAITPLLRPVCGEQTPLAKALDVAEADVEPPLHTNPVVLHNNERGAGASLVTLLFVALFPLVLIAVMLATGVLTRVENAMMGTMSMHTPVRGPTPRS